MAPTLETTGDAGVRGSTVWFRDRRHRAASACPRCRAIRSRASDRCPSGGSPGAAGPSGTPTPLAVDDEARTGSRSRDFEFTRDAGASTLSLTAVDGVGRRRVTKLSVKADGDTPTLTVVSPTRQTWLGSHEATIRFDAADASSGIGTLSAEQQRAPLPSKAAGCSGVTWIDDGSIEDVRGDRFTATDLERDTCYRWVITATDRVGHSRAQDDRAGRHRSDPAGRRRPDGRRRASAGRLIGLRTRDRIVGAAQGSRRHDHLRARPNRGRRRVLADHRVEGSAPDRPRPRSPTGVPPPCRSAPGPPPARGRRGPRAPR